MKWKCKNKSCNWTILCIFFLPIFVNEFNFLLVYSKCYVTWTIVFKTKQNKTKIYEFEVFNPYYILEKKTYINPNLPIKGGGGGIYIQYLLNIFCMLYESNDSLIYLNLKGFSFHISSCIDFIVQ